MEIYPNQNSPTDFAEEPFFETDWNLATLFCNRVQKQAMFGDLDFLKCNLILHQIPQMFDTAAEIMRQIGRSTFKSNCTYAYEIVGDVMARLMVGSTVLFHFQGASFPDHPGILYVKITGERTLENVDDQRILLLVRMANRIATLAKPAYDAAIKNLVFRVGTSGILYDETNGLSSEFICEALNHWCCLPGKVLMIPKATSADEAEICRIHLESLRVSGNEIVEAAKKFIMQERHLIAQK